MATFFTFRWCTGSKTGDNHEDVMHDDNTRKKAQKLVQHWNTFSVVQTWDSRNNDFKFQTVDGEQNDIKSFLAQHATEHMGYHTPT